mmetsp:Transcript_15936/g.23135  ORF Transcript_15936/g.23135 Transcript_15936/m.23135 type:complete len:124 (+) Transcript_15936:1326-1697(+)
MPYNRKIHTTNGPIVLVLEFFCHSPHHSRNVPLVLNTKSGNVSPQFHCIYDDDFDTCKQDTNFTSQWQYKAKLASRSYSIDPSFDISPTLSTQSPLLPHLPPLNSRYHGTAFLVSPLFLSQSV